MKEPKESKESLFKRLVEGDYYLVKAAYKGPNWVLSRLKIGMLEGEYKQTVFTSENSSGSYEAYIVLCRTEMFSKKGQIKFLKTQNIIKLLYD